MSWERLEWRDWDCKNLIAKALVEKLPEFTVLCCARANFFFKVENRQERSSCESLGREVWSKTFETLPMPFTNTTCSRLWLSYTQKLSRYQLIQVRISKS